MRGFCLLPELGPKSQEHSPSLLLPLPQSPPITSEGEMRLTQKAALLGDTWDGTCAAGYPPLKGGLLLARHTHTDLFFTRWSVSGVEAPGWVGQAALQRPSPHGGLPLSGPQGLHSQHLLSARPGALRGLTAHPSLPAGPAGCPAADAGFTLTESITPGGTGTGLGCRPLTCGRLGREPRGRPHCGSPRTRRVHCVVQRPGRTEKTIQHGVT